MTPLRVFPVLLLLCLVARPAAAGIPSQLWFPNTVDDDVSIVDLAGNTSLAEIPPEFEELFPVAVAVSTEGKTWVAFENTGSLVRWTDTSLFIDIIDVGGSPVAVALDPEANAWVSDSDGGSVIKVSALGSIIFGPGGSEGPAIPVGCGPRGIAVDQQGNVYVAVNSDETIVKLNGDGEITATLQLPEGSAPNAVAIDREGFVWVTLPFGEKVLRLASDLTIASEFDLDGTQPSTIAIRGVNEAWVADGSSTVFHRLRPDPDETTTFPPLPGTSLSGTAIDAEGFIWFTEEGETGKKKQEPGQALRVSPAGTLVLSVEIGFLPEFLGDASGYAQANMLFPDEDFDRDGFENAVEIDAGSNPFDPEETPPDLPGYVAPVEALSCLASGQDVSLTWEVPERNFYESIVVFRDGSEIAILGANAESYDDLGLEVGTYFYEVFAMEEEGQSVAATCQATIGQGQILDEHAIQVGDLATNIFDITAVAGSTNGGSEPAYYVTDPGNDLILGLDSGFVVVEMIESPFAGTAPITGIAYDAAGNGGDGSLFVAAGANGDFGQVATLREIDLTGAPLSPPLVLCDTSLAPIGGGVGGLGHHNEVLMAVVPDNCVLFGISTTGDFDLATPGDLLVEILPDASAPHPEGGFGLNGVDFTKFTDFDETGGVVYVTRLNTVGNYFEMAPLEIESGVASFEGVDQSPIPLASANLENSFGGFEIVGDQIAVVGITTTTVYELQGGFFIRGDVDGNGIFTVADPIQILSTLFESVPLGSCVDAYDVVDDGVLDLVDGMFLLNHLFLGAPDPSAPYPTPGSDPTADLLPCL